MPIRISRTPVYFGSVRRCSPERAWRRAVPVAVLFLWHLLNPRTSVGKTILGPEDLAVSAKVIGVCKISPDTKPLIFPQQETSQTNADTETGEITVICSVGLPYKIGLRSQNRGFMTHQQNRQEKISYVLFQPSSNCSTPWSETDRYENTGKGTLTPETLEVCGKITPGRFAPGHYEDVITVEIEA